MSQNNVPLLCQGIQDMCVRGQGVHGVSVDKRHVTCQEYGTCNMAMDKESVCQRKRATCQRIQYL